MIEYPPIEDKTRGTQTMSADITTQDVLDSIDEEYRDDVSDDLIETQLTSFKDFGVTGKSLLEGVQKKVADEVGTPVDKLLGKGDGKSNSGPAPLLDVSDIDTPEEWVTVEVELDQLWEPRSEKIAQVGLVKDGTGRIKFTSWAKSDLMILTEGTQYRLENVRTSEYEGRMSIELNSSTEISFLEEEKDMSNETEFEGALVALQSGSGLIKRCPEDDCNRPLGKNDRCPEHGEVDGVHDLRIKAVLDNGSQTQTVIINDNDLIEELTGITLADGKEMARDALDHAVVGKEMEDTLLGKYYTASGPYINYFVSASEFEQTAEMPDVDSLLIEARSL